MSEPGGAVSVIRPPFLLNSTYACRRDMSIVIGIFVFMKDVKIVKDVNEATLGPLVLGPWDDKRRPREVFALD